MTTSRCRGLEGILEIGKRVAHGRETLCGACSCPNQVSDLDVAVVPTRPVVQKDFVDRTTSPRPASGVIASHGHVLGIAYTAYRCHRLFRSRSVSPRLALPRAPHCIGLSCRARPPEQPVQASLCSFAAAAAAAALCLESHRNGAATIGSCRGLHQSTPNARSLMASPAHSLPLLGPAPPRTLPRAPTVRACAFSHACHHRDALCPIDGSLHLHLFPLPPPHCELPQMTRDTHAGLGPAAPIAVGNYKRLTCLAEESSTSQCSNSTASR